MKEFLQKKKKFLLLALVVVLFAFLLFGVVSAAHAAGAIPPASQNTSGGSSSCGFMEIHCYVTYIIFIPFMLTGWILWAGGQILNAVMQYTVVDMQTNISAITGINIAWGVIRDVMNLTFIFILLYTAIGTILDLSGVNWKKSLVSIIIAAILINFSMFFTKVIIDASNIITLTFYRQLVPTSAPVGSGLSETFMQPLNLTTLYDSNQGSQLVQKAGTDFSTAAIVSIGGSIFLVVTAIVFLAVSVMFLIRYVNFIFLLTLSPVAFMGSIVPKLGKWVDKWWSNLWSEVLFAPVFMLLVWVVATIIQSPAFVCSGGATGTSGKIADTFIGLSGGVAASGGTCITSSGIGMIMNFVIIISFMIGALIAAKELANQGGSVGQKLVSGMLGFGGAAVGGIGGYTGRRIIGDRALTTAQDKDLLDRAAKGDIRARLKLAAARKAASSSFDVRAATSGIAKAGGVVGIKTGFEDFGKAGGKGGYNAYLKEKVKEKKEYAEQFEPSEVEKDEANQELERAKEPLLNAVKDLGIHMQKIDEKRALMDKETDSTKKAQLRTDLEGLEKEKVLKENNLAIVKEESREKIKVAQTQVDILKGVDEEEAKKRLQKKLGIDDKEFKKYLKENKDKAEAQIEALKVTSVGSQRKEAYARSITKEPTANIFGAEVVMPSTNRVMFYGPVKRENKLVVAEIRKKKKPVKDVLEGLLKEQGELKTKDDEESTTTAGPGAPAGTPPAAPSGGAPTT